MGDKYSSRRPLRPRGTRSSHPSDYGIWHPGRKEDCAKCRKPRRRRKKPAEWPVLISRRRWRAVVAFFRAEERLLVDQFGVLPDRRKNFEAAFRKVFPQDWKRYAEARRAIAAVKRGKA